MDLDLKNQDTHLIYLISDIIEFMVKIEKKWAVSNNYLNGKLKQLILQKELLFLYYQSKYF